MTKEEMWDIAVKTCGTQRHAWDSLSEVVALESPECVEDLFNALLKCYTKSWLKEIS